MSDESSLPENAARLMGSVDLLTRSAERQMQEFGQLLQRAQGLQVAAVDPAQFGELAAQLSQINAKIYGQVPEMAFTPAAPTPAEGAAPTAVSAAGAEFDAACRNLGELLAIGQTRSLEVDFMLAQVRGQLDRIAPAQA